MAVRPLDVVIELSSLLPRRNNKPKTAPDILMQNCFAVSFPSKGKEYEYVLYNWPFHSRG